MRKYILSLSLVLMLKVWYCERSFNSIDYRDCGSGVVIGTLQAGERLIVRNDKGKIDTIFYPLVTKSKWVEVSAGD